VGEVLIGAHGKPNGVTTTEGMAPNDASVRVKKFTSKDKVKQFIEIYRIIGSHAIIYFSMNPLDIKKEFLAGAQK
jgi:hypothetical protein